MSAGEDVINEMIVSRVRELLAAGDILREPVLGVREVGTTEHLVAIARQAEARARTVWAELAIRDLLKDLDQDKKPRVSTKRRTPK